MFLHTWVEASSLAKSNDPLLIKYYVDFWGFFSGGGGGRDNPKPTFRNFTM